MAAIIVFIFIFVRFVVALRFVRAGILDADGCVLCQTHIRLAISTRQILLLSSFLIIFTQSEHKKNILPKRHNLHFLYDKELLATNRLDGSPNVLIDDKPTNIKKWNDAGGIGLQFQANKDKGKSG